jgi:Zn-dependent protease
MNRSFRVLTVRGIDIRLHITFPLILLWAAFQFSSFGGGLSSAIFGVLVISLLFVLVTLHELGHSFAAMRYGVAVEQIVLSPIGGIAQLQRMPDKPVQEFVIAIAGPAVNVLAAIVMGLGAWLLPINLLNPLAVLGGGTSITLSSLFTYVFIYNIFLAVFNLLPAFPMDGGRVLRSLLAMRLDYARATQIAAAVGRGFAVLLGLYGFFSGGIFLVFIALFIFFGAGQEVQMARLREALRRFTVQQAFSSQGYRLHAYATLGQARELMLFSGQGTFPVFHGDAFVGLLSRPALQSGLQRHGAEGWVADAMTRNVAPALPDEDLYSVKQRLDNEKLEALPVIANGRYLGLITLGAIQRIYQQLVLRPRRPSFGTS